LSERIRLQPIFKRVVAGLVPGTSLGLALYFNYRGRWDKPGDDNS
jgi:hypothetical protein